MMKPFEEFTQDDWRTYWHSLNVEKRADECGLQLTRIERREYQKYLAALKRERKTNPDFIYFQEFRYQYDFEQNAQSQI